MFSPPSRKLPRPSVPDANRPMSTATLNSPQPPTIQMQTYPGNHPGSPPLQTQPSFPPPHRDSREHNRDRPSVNDHPRRGSERERTGSGDRKKEKLQKTKDGKYYISPEEDIRRLLEECEMARANAQLLSSQLTYAGPKDLLTNEVIKVSLD
jgi:hypothetical protein